MKKFIYTVVLASCCFALAGCGSSKNSDTKKEDKQESKTPKKEKKVSENKIYKIGETASYKRYEIKVNSMTFSAGNEYYKAGEGKQFVVVNVTITNKSDEKQSYSGMDFKLNVDGNTHNTVETADFLENTELDNGDLDKNASVTGDVIVGQSATTSKLKLVFAPHVFDDKTLDFKLN